MSVHHPARARRQPGQPVNAVPHILVVDDEPEIREVIREYLTGKGYAVSVAADGRAMRAVLAERPVHLVVLDMIMPGEDGLTLARELRRLPGLGIVMLTAMADMKPSRASSARRWKPTPGASVRRPRCAPPC